MTVIQLCNFCLKYLKVWRFNILKSIKVQHDYQKYTMSILSYSRVATNAFFVFLFEEAFEIICGFHKTYLIIAQTYDKRQKLTRLQGMNVQVSIKMALS